MYCTSSFFLRVDSNSCIVWFSSVLCVCTAFAWLLRHSNSLTCGKSMTVNGSSSYKSREILLHFFCLSSHLTSLYTMILFLYFNYRLVVRNTPVYKENFSIIIILMYTAHAHKTITYLNYSYTFPAAYIVAAHAAALYRDHHSHLRQTHWGHRKPNDLSVHYWILHIGLMLIAKLL